MQILERFKANIVGFILTKFFFSSSRLSFKNSILMLIRMLLIFSGDKNYTIKMEKGKER